MAAVWKSSAWPHRLTLSQRRRCQDPSSLCWRNRREDLDIHGKLWRISMTETVLNAQHLGHCLIDEPGHPERGGWNWKTPISCFKFYDKDTGIKILDADKKKMWFSLEIKCPLKLAMSKAWFPDSDTAKTWLEHDTTDVTKSLAHWWIHSWSVVRWGLGRERS